MRLGLLYMLPLLSRRFASSRTVARRMASLSEVERGAAGARCMVDKLLAPPKIPVADLGLAQEDRAAARHAFQRRVFDDAFAGRRTPRVVSVVGTKGKGSCSELLRAALHEDGRYGAVGCFTSLSFSSAYFSAGCVSSLSVFSACVSVGCFSIIALLSVCASVG